ncbi:MAG: hypothetical protein ACC654_00610 [Acidimicrobiia bacterium]
MRNLVVLGVALLLIATACTLASNELVTTTAPIASSQSEADWCNVFTNYPAIAKEAIRLQVDGYAPLEVEQKRILDNLGAPFLDNFLGGFLELEWKDGNVSGFAQACTAAYAQR